MVEDVLKRIEKEVFEKWNIKKFIAIHRLGYIKVGEISVIVGVSSEHRKEAFEGCNYGIDNIKKRCPIWKKEKMESGDSKWVEGVTING
jgi:molybdopterin synthase catalytic subunit